ncbi:MAG: CopY family transcriptional regulator [Aeromicrobium sp.]|uniref:BlaI/MecI/CopY family transcriptional regulator n=1 Tax=Aeromicrobium sp. TaxID=1871063 RepID=UPI00262C5E5D|nr:BlaI/MecI/CopY family transcriptional regulator [Aeromicrobium sp.]MCW2788034.1 CopY family transcriptional regulator [Aeromicrobium sp.]MCW2825604.1 CopY family transcriptional regulator [Aeromicrobium sp.]
MPHLGELERSVMNILWDAPGPHTVREVLDALGERDLAYTTVMTVLDRLGAKQMVRRERDGRAFRYAPAISRDAATAELLHAALDHAGTDRTAALVHFAHTVDPAEAEALRAALDEIASRTSR